MANDYRRYLKCAYDALVTGKSDLIALYLKRCPVEMPGDRLLAQMALRAPADITRRKLPPFFFDPDTADKICGIIAERYRPGIETAIADADEICAHRFAFLGPDTVAIGDKLPWHSDFRHGFSWDPEKRYLGTRAHIDAYYKPGICADVKIPWELSRCQHFPTLGKAYWHTGDEKYAREYVAEIDDWIASNPVELGVNWACTMDVAIRAVNWIWGYYFFARSAALTDEFRLRLFGSLYLHGRHISRNLEDGKIRNNHYLADVVGLVFLGAFFGGTPEGDKWLQNGYAAIVEEMSTQVREDGTDFESSIGYHRLALELFATATVLCTRQGMTFPDSYTRHLERMFEFVLSYTKPDGKSPQIGDLDDGRLQVLESYYQWDRLDHRYLLALGAALFQREDLKSSANGFPEECFWLLGEEGLRLFESLGAAETVSRSNAFIDGGYYVMRNADRYMIIDALPDDRCAPYSHRHNNRLGIEVYAGGRMLIMDPGTYVYTSDKEMRNLFRSTRYHNTVVVDNEEQNRLSDDVFTISPDAVVKVNAWHNSAVHDFFDAEHDGYRKLKEPVMHRRKVYFNKSSGYWIIRDYLEGKGLHKIDLYFHLCPCRVAQKGNIAYTADDGKGNVIMAPLSKDGIAVNLGNGNVSPGYGIKTEAPVIRFSKDGVLPLVFTTLIYPFAGDEEREYILDHLDQYSSEADEAFQ